MSTTPARRQLTAEVIEAIEQCEDNAEDEVYTRGRAVVRWPVWHVLFGPMLSFSQ